jgi:hypothetical protein
MIFKHNNEETSRLVTSAHKLDEELDADLNRLK